MTRTVIVLSSALVVFTLAVPPAAGAQGSRRGGGSSGGGGAAQPRPAGNVSAPAPRSAPSTNRVTRPSSTRTEAGAPARSGSAALAANRSRGQAALGTAQPRQAIVRPGGPGGQGYYGHRWYPSSYYPYYGGYYPYYGYPYYGYPYGGGHWSIGFSVGFGYGWPYYGPYPYAYAYPYPYPGYAYPYYWRGGVTVVPGDGDDDNREERDPAPREEIREVPETPTGSLRLRVTPRAARVYVDGALAGVVDEFDGLSSHLKIPAGPHTIEFRADGYESLRIDTTVEPNKTRTERVTLRKQAAAD